MIFVWGGVVVKIVVLFCILGGVLSVVLKLCCDWFDVVVGFGGYLIILVMGVVVLMKLF